MSNKIENLIEIYLSGKMTVVEFVEALRKAGLTDQEVSDLLWEEGCVL